MENEILVPGYGKMTENAILRETWVRSQMVTDANMQGNFALAAKHAKILAMFLDTLAAQQKVA